MKVTRQKKFHKWLIESIGITLTIVTYILWLVSIVAFFYLLYCIVMGDVMASMLLSGFVLVVAIETISIIKFYKHNE